LQKYITINPGNADMDLVIGGNGSPAMTFDAGLTRFLMKDNLKLSFGDDDDGHIKYVSADNEHEVILKLPNSDPGVDYQLYYDCHGYVRINLP
jgi:hypothetical protein